MKKLSLPLLLFLTIVCTQRVQAQALQAQKTLKKTMVEHFFSCPLDQMLDTLSMQYKLRFIFERQPIHEMDVVEHFFNESLLDVLKTVCEKNDLHYWLENDGTIYILQQPDDLERLQQLNKMNQTLSKVKPKTLDPPKGPPTHFMFSISGRVVDQNTGEALPGAIVKVRNTELSTGANTSGNFTLLNVPADTCVLEVSYMGYQPDKFRLDDEKIKGSLVLTLFPSMNALNEVVITDKKHGVINTDSKKVSVLQLTPAALDKLPNIGERDILRSFQLMPGVSGSNESSSGAYVRGGTPDQNLVTFDGFTVYQVDHLYGFYSAFNPNAVRDVEMYKGGYSAKYGGRLSAVTEIRGKDGNKNETNFGGDISLLSLNLYAETPLNKNSSALISFRRSYQGPLYDKIFGQFNKSTVTSGGGGGPGGRGGFMNQTTPSSYFYDLNAKYTYAPSDKNSFSWTYYSGTDHLDNSRDLNFPSFVASYTSDLHMNDYTKSGNIGTSGKWVSTWGKKLFSNTVLSYSQFNSDHNQGTTGTVTDSGTTTNVNNGILEHNRLRDLSLKSDWEWQAGSKYKVLFGGYGSYLNIDYDYTQNDTISLISQHNTGVVAGSYAELEYDPTSNLHIQPGLRETYYSPTGKVYTEPRFNATYHLTDRFNLKVAGGRFYQFTNLVTREDILNGNRTFWTLADGKTMPVSSANHYIAGFNYETKDFLIDVEGYYKQLNGLTQYSIRQQGGSAFSSVGTATTITENYYVGNGWAKGVEILLQKKVGVYTGWIAYTLAQSKSKFSAYGNDYFPSDQDVRNEFKSINMYHLQRWSFAATWIYATGHPYTAPLGSYTINTIDGSKQTYLTISDKNGERLPAYHRLDLSATYDLLKINGSKVGSIGFSLFNAYNHINTWYKQYSIQNNQVVTSNVNYLGMTPNITLSLRWK
jgi:ferric enterobactin receptor